MKERTMKRAPLISVILVILFLAMNQTAHADLFGLSSSDDTLYTVDATTGDATLLHELDENVSFTGLAFLGDQLWATDIYEGGWRTGTIDLSTGDFTAVSTQDGDANWHGLAADQDTGLLYSIDTSYDRLKSLDPTTGVVTTIASGTGIDGRGMAYDDASDILYATDYSHDLLYSIDTATGTKTEIGGFGIDVHFYVGMAYDEINDTLFLNTLSNLYEVDTSTGMASLIGDNDFGNIDGLAWYGTVPEPEPVPEPATMLLLGSGLVGLAGFRRKKKT